MLLSTVLMLRPLADVMLPMTLGNAFYTAMLRMVAHYDQDLAARLHDTDGPKPFTTSPLQGPVTVRDRQLLVQRDRDYWLRVTSVENASPTSSWPWRWIPHRRSNSMVGSLRWCR